MNKINKLEERNLNISVNVDVWSVIDVLDLTLDHDEVVEFVKLLDLAVADWDVTLALHDYFKEQKKIHDTEVAEDED